MLARTDKFKEEIKKLGKQIDFKIGIHINDRLITQDNKFILTQDNAKLIVEQYDEEDVDEILSGESIYNVSVVRKGNLLSTMLKEVDFEIEEELRVGNVIDCSFGLKVDDDYEYINYGKFIIYSKERNEDTNTYSYVAYDSMLLSMVEVDDTSIIQGVTVKQAIENICEKVGLNVNITSQDIENLPNLTKIINQTAFTDIEMTYRDVLDMICQCLGVSMVSDSKNLYLKTLNDTIVDTFDEEYLKDINVTFGKKYGPVNSVVLSRSEGNDNIYRQDQESIDQNGLNEFKIKDNLIMLYDDRDDYIDEIFEQLNGLEFYINDFTSTGITYLEPLDFYNVTIGENSYKCLLLNDEIKVQQGLEETIYTEMPEETNTDYKTSAKSDKEVSFIVDKQNGKISSRVTEDEMESYVEQTASQLQSQITDNAENISTLTQTAEEINIEVGKKYNTSDFTNAKITAKINDGTSSVQISASKISLAGKTIQMTSDNIAINSTNFQVDKNGNMSCNNANVSGTVTSNNGTIGGWTINNTGLTNGTVFIHSDGSSTLYTVADLIIVRGYIMGYTGFQLPTQMIKHYDFNNDGQVTPADYVTLQNLIGISMN